MARTPQAHESTQPGRPDRDRTLTPQEERGEQEPAERPDGSAPEEHERPEEETARSQYKPPTGGDGQPLSHPGFALDDAGKVRDEPHKSMEEHIAESNEKSYGFDANPQNHAAVGEPGEDAPTDENG